MKKQHRWKKKKFVKTISKTKTRIIRGRKGKKQCTVCGKQLHGLKHGKTKHALAKFAKTEKKPNIKFAGVLCNKCRRQVMEEVGKILAGWKNEEKNLETKKYIEKILKEAKE